MKYWRDDRVNLKWRSSLPKTGTCRRLFNEGHLKEEEWMPQQQAYVEREKEVLDGGQIVLEEGAVPVEGAWQVHPDAAPLQRLSVYFHRAEFVVWRQLDSTME